MGVERSAQEEKKFIKRISIHSILHFQLHFHSLTSLTCFWPLSSRSIALLISLCCQSWIPRCRGSLYSLMTQVKKKIWLHETKYFLGPCCLSPTMRRIAFELRWISQCHSIYNFIISWYDCKQRAQFVIKLNPKSLLTALIQRSWQCHQAPPPLTENYLLLSGQELWGNTVHIC